MAVSYNKLWKKLIDLEMSKGELRVKAGISTRQLAKLGKNENVTTDVLVKVCKALKCNIDEIMDILERKEENE
ncbi:MAG: helix-turn-helix transcriptional regulator [Lachnospiraceae bacterium]|nr:helix-turn-helix transcriptional regulator [Lachnospiraceae bacterium]